MSINNFDNKFGSCCNCPGFYSGNRVFTNWESSRIYNDKIQKILNISNSNSYRSKLQSLDHDIFNNNNVPKCLSNNNNKFYIDSSNY